MRTARRASVAGVLVFVLLTLLPAAPAWAHATLVESTPGDGTVMAQQPAEVTLRYDEGVSTALGAVRVLAPDGSRVDTGDVTRRDGDRTVAVALRPGLAPGTYTLLWRVLSADNHTVFGSSTFSVGRPSATVADTSQDSTGGRVSQAVLGSFRGLLYAGLVLLVGGLGFLLVLWPTGRTVARVRRVLWAGWGVAVLAGVGELLMQGPYAAGRSPAEVLDLGLLTGVLGTGYGIAGVVRLVLLAAFVPVLRGLDGAGRGTLAGVTGVLGLGVLVATSVVGHAGTGDLAFLALPADVLHLAAASAWVGGLVLVATVLLRRDPDEQMTVLPRWSRYAATSVAVLAVTGAFAGWREIREWGALFGTTHGRLLLVKVGLVVVMLGLAALGRAWILRHRSAPASSDAVAGNGGVATAVRVAPAPSVAGLRRGVLLETGLAVVVLAVTAALVGSTPARNDWFPPFVASATVRGDLQLQVDVEAPRIGFNTMNVTYTAAGGRPTDVVKASARWVRPGTDDVVPVALLRRGPGRYGLSGIQLPAGGPWQLAVATQTSDIDSTTILFTVPVR